MRNFLLNRTLKKQPDQAKYNGFAAAKTVMLVFDETALEPRPEIEELKNLLEKEGKQVVPIRFYQAKKPKENLPPNTYFRADCALAKNPRKRVYNGLPSAVDVLIDWTKGNPSPNDFISARINAPLKLGVDRNLPCFALVIKGHGHMPGKVIEEIMKYIKLINHE